MAYEDFDRSHLVEGSSDRAFGLVFCAGFLVIALLPAIHADKPRWWAGVIAAGFAAAALLRPALLSGLNRWWTKLGHLLGRIVSPIALGILFYGVLTPVGFVMRLMGKDPLLLKRDVGAASYWHRREPPGPPPNSMTQQF